MKLDLTRIKNESILKFEKSLKRAKIKYQDMLAIALDASIHEIDQEKRASVEIVLNDMLNDQFSKQWVEFTRCMNKVNEMVEKELNS